MNYRNFDGNLSATSLTTLNSMQLINKVDINYYRSLKRVTVRDLKDLNIFSGKNDIGKSNVLKALDTFFNKRELNFVDDFNKDRLGEVRKDSVKGKQYIKISVEFNNPGSYSTLPERFTVTKSWDRNGHQTEGIKENFEYLKRRGKFETKNIEISRRMLTTFMNRIRYTYVPAIRDESFFAFLINRLQETIFAVEERKRNLTFQNTIANFNETIGTLTTALNDEFESVSGISSSLSFPNEISEIFQRLIVDTKSGEHEIPLRLRGDGIRLRYIPTILNYISTNSKYLEVWGFDEPENSCEYSLSQKIAEQFEREYSKKTQIFVATHSFHFISISSTYASKYRVYRVKDSLNTDVAPINDSTENLLADELGVLSINNKLSEVYEKLTEELRVVNKTKLALKESEKPYLIFEGKTDNSLFETAYLSLNGVGIDSKYQLNEHLTNSEGASLGSGAKFITDFLKNHITKLGISNRVIAIFDGDKTGIDEILSLKHQFTRLNQGSDNYILFQHSTKKNVFAMTLVAPPHRTQFFNKLKSDYSYLSSELLLQDSEIPAPNRHPPTLFDDTVFSFSGNKASFAETIKANAATIDFSGFVPSLTLISDLAERAI